MIDATIVSAHQHSAGALMGDRAVKRLDVVKVDQYQIRRERRCAGQSRAFISIPRGQFAPQQQTNSAELSSRYCDDKAYDVDERVIGSKPSRGKTVVIPPKRNRTTLRQYDKHLYKARHLIENFR